MTRLFGADDTEYMKNYVFVDESGFQPASFKRRGYALRGITPRVRVVPKEKQISIVGAISGQEKVLVDYFVPAHKKTILMALNSVGI